MARMYATDKPKTAVRRRLNQHSVPLVDMASRRRTGTLLVPGMPISERQQLAMIREMMIKEEGATTPDTQTSGA